MRTSTPARASTGRFVLDATVSTPAVQPARAPISEWGRVDNSPITYMVGGKQYVSVKSGLTLFTFGLRD